VQHLRAGGQTTEEASEGLGEGFLELNFLLANAEMSRFLLGWMVKNNGQAGGCKVPASTLSQGKLTLLFLSKTFLLNSPALP